MITLDLKPYMDGNKKKISKPKKSNLSIKRNVTLICEVNINGQYFATNEYGDVHYPFTEQSYKVKCSRFYAIELYKNKRLDCKILKESTCGKGYLPFAPGIGVLGDIITLENKTCVFDFKRVVDIDSDKAKECFLFYRNNYNEIRTNYILTHND